VGKLNPEQQASLRFRMQCISPDEGKYGKEAEPLRIYLSANAEWKTCAYIQKVILETREEFGQATLSQVEEVENALDKLDLANMSLLERKLNHDQLAVIAEIGRHVSPETVARLHPGTTSYDILDTARSYLFKKAWRNVVLPEIKRVVDQTIDVSKIAEGFLQVGRTHLQDTSPVLLSGVFAGYAARVAERSERCNEAFSKLKGKISGIVGTGASIDIVIGKGKSLEFEKKVLEKLGLEPDYCATQIVQKEGLSDVGHYLSTLSLVLGDFANDVRMMHSSAIKELISINTSTRLGGSSADAAKDNPLDWENSAGKVAVIIGGMGVLYSMIQSDFQRDLRGSVQARYQPQLMITEIYESLIRLNKAIPQLRVNEENLKRNLIPVRNNPSEAMVAILRGEGWIHSKYGNGHDFVKEMSKNAKRSSRNLLEVCLEDGEFRQLYSGLVQDKREVLEGKFENYIESAHKRKEENIKNAISTINRLCIY
ncbi:hypothetical protein HYW75_04440, partial [Candidatus Pacearchaeota archaeon]|nr:hypothetical protein [Candidatus Pacearchaeota archaeon]